MHDLVIRHGTVIDGTGRDRTNADVAVDGGTHSFQVSKRCKTIRPRAPCQDAWCAEGLQSILLPDEEVSFQDVEESREPTAVQLFEFEADADH